MRDWKRVVHLSGTKSKSIQALLRDVTPDRLDGTTLVLRSRFEFHQKTLERPDTRTVVEGVLEELYSSRLTIRCVVGPPEEGDKPVVTDPVDGAQADPRVRAALEAGYRVVHIGPGEREES
ncbi:MAG: hypothetical protein HYY04_18025 [Chloroflexi bacterium]|nr:hypothetical protein [Chloroflexota bacterium]